MVVALSPVLAIYALNPNNRVYSAHGFLHAGIAYEIYNHGIPPVHPYLAGEPLLYSWGHEALAAWTMRLLQVSPFKAFALINVVSLALVVVLAWRVARRLFDHPMADACAVFMGIYASTFSLPWLVMEKITDPLRFELIHPRGVPALEKFTNVNGTALGVVFFLLWLLALIRILEQRRVWPFGMLMFTSIAGCAFFYPPMLMGLVCGTFGAGAGVMLCEPMRRTRRDLSILLGTSAIAGAALVLMRPYLGLISSGFSARVSVLDPRFMFESARNLAYLALPTLLLIWCFRRRLLERVHRVPLLAVAWAAATHAAMYLVLRQPAMTEYKYLVMAMIGMGLLGGVCLAFTWERRNRTLFWVLGGLLFVNPTYEVVRKLRYGAHRKVIYAEEGTDVHYKGSKQAGQLYNWIRQYSPEDALFIDDTGLTPIFGQRRLFMGPRHQLVLGFHTILYKILYTPAVEILEERTRVATGRATATERRRVLDVGAPIFRVIDERRANTRDLDPVVWEQVFRSSGGRCLVYRWTGR